MDNPGYEPFWREMLYRILPAALGPYAIIGFIGIVCKIILGHDSFLGSQSYNIPFREESQEATPNYYPYDVVVTAITEEAQRCVDRAKIKKQILACLRAEGFAKDEARLACKDDPSYGTTFEDNNWYPALSAALTERCTKKLNPEQCSTGVRNAVDETKQKYQDAASRERAKRAEMKTILIRNFTPVYKMRSRPSSSYVMPR